MRTSELVLDLRRAPKLSEALRDRTGFDRPIEALAVLSGCSRDEIGELYFADIGKAFEECNKFLRELGLAPLAESVFNV
jgi:hypothetical protein